MPQQRFSIENCGYWGYKKKKKNKATKEKIKLNIWINKMMYWHPEKFTYSETTLEISCSIFDKWMPSKTNEQWVCIWLVFVNKVYFTQITYVQLGEDVVSK